MGIGGTILGMYPAKKKPHEIQSQKIEGGGRRRKREKGGRRRGEGKRDTPLQSGRINLAP
jgi:hypothetical protein